MYFYQVSLALQLAGTSKSTKVDIAKNAATLKREGTGPCTGAIDGNRRRCQDKDFWRCGEHPFDAGFRDRTLEISRKSYCVNVIPQPSIQALNKEYGHDSSVRSIPSAGCRDCQSICGLACADQRPAGCSRANDFGYGVRSIQYSRYSQLARCAKPGHQRQFSTDASSTNALAPESDQTHRVCRHFTSSIHDMRLPASNRPAAIAKSARWNPVR